MSWSKARELLSGARAHSKSHLTKLSRCAIVYSDASPSSTCTLLRSRRCSPRRVSLTGRAKAFYNESLGIPCAVAVTERKIVGEAFHNVERKKVKRVMMDEMFHRAKLAKSNNNATLVDVSVHSKFI